MIATGDREALDALTAGLPQRWRASLRNSLEAKAGGYRPGQRIALGAAAFQAKQEIARAVQTLAAAPLPLDAADADVCARSDALAEWCMSLGTLPELRWLAERGDADGPPAFWPKLAAKMQDVAESQGIEPPPARRGARSACARMMCALWWRRALRKAQARHMEGAAIALGLVNRKTDPYISRESLARRQQQNKRNADTLARTVATNEHGQEFTLAELAAKGTANKTIRRAELMTRIAGFERIARDLGHAGTFLTITCPSRMHKWRTVAGGRVVVENPKYDGTLPREAQAYLSKLWARARAKLARRKIRVYGFRIAEPQHDETPHWHCLFFHAPEHADELAAVIRHYALQDSPDENGAHRRRVDIKAIDWSKGSAAGYIAKYVAKNIDGHALETDLTGESILTVPARVEAWAATWGIRQFQQVGGPPVTVWRELRRVKDLPDNVPDALRAAHVAVNREEGEGETRAADWAGYVKAQGGVYCGRRYGIRLVREAREGAGRYGDPLAPAVVGVTAYGARAVDDGIATRRDVRALVRSVRYAWTIKAGHAAPQAGNLGNRAAFARRGSAFDVARLAAPWTRVINCTPRPWWHGVTDPDESDHPHLFHLYQRETIQ